MGMKNKILNNFPHLAISIHSNDLYVVDYTEQTKNLSIKKTVKIQINKPDDIESFLIKNPLPEEIGTIVFDNNSFVDENNLPKTQCECVCFLNKNAESKPWLLFLELKYCLKKNAVKKLNEAKKQVFATMGYFKSKGIIAKKQFCYLIVSLPKQNNSPFENFIMLPAEVARLKKEESIIFRGVNEVTIANDNTIDL